MPRSLLEPESPPAPAVLLRVLAAQLVLLMRAQNSPDLVFGFQMFNASSELKISLFRKVRRRGRSRLVPVRDGAWEIKDRAGTSTRTAGKIAFATAVSAPRSLRPRRLRPRCAAVPPAVRAARFRRSTYRVTTKPKR